VPGRTPPSGRRRDRPGTRADPAVDRGRTVCERGGPRPDVVNLLEHGLGHRRHLHLHLHHQLDLRGLVGDDDRANRNRWRSGGRDRDPSNFSGGRSDWRAGSSRTRAARRRSTPAPPSRSRSPGSPTRRPPATTRRTVTTKNGGTVVDSGVSGSVTFTAGALISPCGRPRRPLDGAGGVTYSYGLTTGTTSPLSAVSMTVPPGTGEAPRSVR